MASLGIFTPDSSPSVLLEAAELFGSAGLVPDCFSDSCEYMLRTVRVPCNQLDTVPAVVHTNHTTGETLSRIHVVRRKANPPYEALLAALKSAIGIPVVLNTSFNASEPIVCTPSQACATFIRSRLDALALGPFLVERI